MVEVSHSIYVVKICAFRLAREFSMNLGGGLGSIFGVGGRSTDLIDEILLVLSPCLTKGLRGKETRNAVFIEVFASLIPIA